MGYGCPCFCLRRGKKMKHEDNKGEKNVNFQCEEPRMATGFSCETNVLGSLCATGFLHEQFHHKARAFTYGELEIATRNFRTDYLIGEGGFGFVFKGQLQDTGQVVAVKRLNQMGLQGNKEFMVEVSMLSLLRHPNLVNMIGFCAEGDQRLLVYELLPLGSLEDRLHDLPSDKEPLDWNTRMRIADGTAKGLDYLHNKADPPVIYRDLKSSNILLGEGFHPKLSDFGLAKFGPSGDKTHVSTRIMGTHGYCAPEYISTGKLTTMSDIYSFGVLLLELITGYRAYDSTRARGMEQLVDLARPMLKDLDSILQLADPRLKGKFPKHILLKAVELAAMCLQEKASSRPFTADVALATNYLITYPYDDLKKEGRTSAEEEVKRHLNKDGEREKAVAEAKMWGVHWRKEIAKCPQSSSNDL